MKEPRLRSSDGEETAVVEVTTSSNSCRRHITSSSALDTDPGDVPSEPAFRRLGDECISLQMSAGSDVTDISSSDT